MKNTPERINLKFLQSLTALSILLLFSSLAVNAQRQSKLKLVAAPTAEAADIDQCQNGPIAAPVGCTVAGDWAGGNSGSSKSHWNEGQSIPDRIRITGLTPGPGQTIEFNYDTTKSVSLHALDYLTTFNRSLVTADPCAGITPCGAPTTFPIPPDPNVSAGPDQIPGNSDDISQIPGVFTMYNGTITSVSGYTLSGPYTGNSSTSITVTFTANDPTVVLAFGLHLARRADWGINNSVIAISGSPFHTELSKLNGASTGVKSVSLTSDAALFPAKLTIVKDFAGGFGTSPQAFSFTSSANAVTTAGATTFTLDDNADPTYSNSIVLENAPAGTSPGEVVALGAGNAITIQEAVAGGSFFLQSISILEAPGGTPAVINSTSSVSTRTATIIPDEGEIITVTFVNNITLGANAAINGRVTTADGAGIRYARIAITNLNTGEVHYTSSSTFGYYRFEDLPVGQVYVFQVSSKGYTFSNANRSLSLSGDIQNFDFVADGIR